MIEASFAGRGGLGRAVTRYCSTKSSSACSGESKVSPAGPSCRLAGDPAERQAWTCGSWTA